MLSETPLRPQNYQVKKLSSEDFALKKHLGLKTLLKNQNVQNIIHLN